MKEAKQTRRNLKFTLVTTKKSQKLFPWRGPLPKNNGSMLKELLRSYLDIFLNVTFNSK